MNMETVAIKKRQVSWKENWKTGHQESATWVLSLSDLMSLLLIFFLVWTTLKFNEQAKNDSPRGDMTKVSQRIKGMMMEFSPLSLDSGNIMVVLQDEILFSSGSFKISEDGKMVLHKIASILKNGDNFRLRIIGHCDNVPIVKGKRFNSNYELSLVRASQVASQLILDGIDPRKILVQGFGELYPAESNKIIKKRRFNRRVELIIEPVI